MPYKRRRPTRRRKRKGRDTVRKVRRAVRKIQRSVETKSLTISHDTFNISDNPHDIFTQPTLTADSGIKSDEFIGQKYHAVGIKVNAVIKKITDNTGQVSAVRFIGLWVRGLSVHSTTTNTFNEYFQLIDSDGNGIDPILAPMLSSKSKVTRTLWDKKYTFGIKNTAAGGFAAGKQNMFVNFYKSINANTVFNVESNEYSQGKLYVWVVDQFANQAAITLVTKFYYTDS